MVSVFPSPSGTLGSKSLESVRLGVLSHSQYYSSSSSSLLPTKLCDTVIMDDPGPGSNDAGTAVWEA